MSSAQPVRVVLISVATVMVSVVATAAVVIAVDVFLLLFLGILLAVFLARTSVLLASATPLSSGWSLSGSVLLLMVTVIGLCLLFGVQIEGQLKHAGTKIDEAAQELRETLKNQDVLRTLVRTVPFAGELLQTDPALLDERQQSQRGGSNSSEHALSAAPSDNSTSAAGQAGTPPGSVANQTHAMTGQIAGVLRKVFATTFGFLTNVAVVAFVGIFLATNPGVYTNGFVSLFPPLRRNRIAQVIEELGQTLWRWLLGRFLSMAIPGVGTGAALWALGVPLAFTIGVITALLTFIPNIEAVIALGLATLLAVPSGGTTVLWVVVLYVALQLIGSYVITPLIQQQQVSIPPALLISFQLLMASLTGFLGVMVSTPLLAAGLVSLQRLYVEDVLDGEARGDS